MLFLSCTIDCRPAAEPPAPRATVYDADPDHLWNRLYSSLYLRTTAEGKVYGHDELEPLLYAESQHLLTGASHKNLLALLDEFLDKEGHRLIKDPVKRAVFQHDLWAVFDWAADPTAADLPEATRHTEERRALQTRLARMIRQLALSAEQIKQLPNNYAAAVASGTVAKAHDPDKADQPFLPPDLFKADGPWVMLEERPSLLGAPAHVRAFGGRSAFFVFLNLPAGRLATVDYLGKLGRFPKPLLPQPARESGVILNPDLPQFPAGTQVALVRELVVIDDHGNLVPTRILEELQFRVYRDIPKEAKKDSKQDFYQFRMRRGELFAEKAGGLRADDAKSEGFGGLNREHLDPFEQPDTRPHPSPILRECVACHARGDGPGIHSVQTYRRGFSYGVERPPDLIDSEQRRQEDALRRWKRQQYDWGLLEGLNK
jgi:hypothetical protein